MVRGIGELKSRTVLVTGGTGMIGRQVCRILRDAGAFVTSVSLDRIRPVDKIRYLYADLTDLKEVENIVGGMDYVFHVAGVKGSAKVTETHPASFFVPLLMMNTNVLETCRRYGVKKTVYVSSIGAYPDLEVFKEEELRWDMGLPPMDKFPGWAKRMAELQIQAYKIQYGLGNFSIVRPCNVYGPGDNFDPDNAMVIPALMAKIVRGDDPVKVWGDGKAIRDFAYSEDVAEGIILAALNDVEGYVNLGGGEEHSIGELVRLMHEVRDFSYEFDVTQPSGFPRRVMDITKAKEVLGYEPKTDLLSGLEKTWEWFMENPHEHAFKKNYFTS